ncbi:jg26406 [Pararge aegeria aegeria]|uniref:Jg26406 protein n=1 Tax=Pararge aegeria aegeria TaxID=348720 RepID=A0A8S4QG80_9NEOP|nr:jg26406 [Pararge aegeria aegeria]
MKDRVRNVFIRNKPKATDVIKHVLVSKLKWAGHIQRVKNERLSHIVTIGTHENLNIAKVLKSPQCMTGPIVVGSLMATGSSRKARYTTRCLLRPDICWVINFPFDEM